MANFDTLAILKISGADGDTSSDGYVKLATADGGGFYYNQVEATGTAQIEVGDIIPDGSVAIATDTGRAYLNSTGADVTLTGATAAELIADGLELEEEGPQLGSLFHSEAISGAFPNPNFQEFTETFTPDVTGVYDIEFSAGSVTSTAWLQVGTSPQTGNIFDGIALVNSRLEAEELTRVYPRTLEAGVPVYFYTGAGGGGAVTDPAVSVRYTGIDRLATETTQFLSQLTRSNVEPVRQEIVDGHVVSILQDASSNFGFYGYVDTDAHLPHTRDFTHRFKVSRNSRFDNFYIRYAWPNNIAFAEVNLAAGTVSTGGNQAALVTAKVLSVTEDWVHVEATWNADTRWSAFTLHPAFGSAAAQGVLGVIDFEYDVTPQEVTTSPIFEGVMVDAAPAWEGSFIVSNGSAIHELDTGVDLTEVDKLIVHFRRRNTNPPNTISWPKTKPVYLADVLNSSAAYLISHLDNQFLHIRGGISAAQLSAGIIPFGANTQTSSFDYEVTKVQFRKRVSGSSPLIGFKFEGPPNLESTIKGVLAVTPRTVTNGAVDNPIFASRWPSLVNGDDLVITADFAGAFSRNLGGEAEVFGTFQPFGTNVDGITASDRFHPNFTGRGNGGNVARNGNSEVQKPLQGGITEGTRPDNFGFQWYFIMDDYVDPTGGVASGQPLSLAYATTTSDRDDPNTGDNIIYDEIHIVSGGVTIVGSTITLPQSDTLYELTWHGGFDFDGNPDEDVVFGFVGSTAPLLKTDAEADAFDTTISGTTFSAFQFFRTSAFALFDASAGEITVDLQVLNGATDIDITEGYIKVSQSPASSVVSQQSVEGLTALPPTGGVLIGGNQYLADHTAAIALTLDPAMPNLAKIVIEDYGNTTLANTIDVGTAADTFNGVAGPMGIDTGTGEYVITKTAPNTYFWRSAI